MANGDGTHGSKNFKTSVGDVVAVVANPAIAVAMSEATWDKKVPTPSQLESQNRSRPASIRAPGSPTNILQRATTWLPQRMRTERSQLSPRREQSSAMPDSAKLKEDVGPVDSDDDESNESEPVHKCPRQQILTVPQIWL